MAGEARPDAEAEVEPSRLVGLAGYYLRASELDRARKLLGLARAAGMEPLRVEMAAARLAILEGDPEGALESLASVREMDPFDEDAADLAGQLLMAAGRPAEALEALLDAQILGGASDPERAAYYGPRLEEAAFAAGSAGAGLEAARAARAERLEELASETEVLAARPRPVRPAEIVSGGAPMRDVLRDVAPFSKLPEDELRLLECTVERIRIPAGEPVFREGQPSEDLYVVESGKVLIQRDTPFGVQVLATVPADALFGEMNFIDGRTRSADAVAAEDVLLLRINHDALREIFEVEPRLALVFMEQFWRGLADKVREGNELMKSFFPEEAGGAAPRPGGTPAPDSAAPSSGASAGRAAGVAAQDKQDVLREKGLSSQELELLARYAEAKSFDAEEAIFREGVPGETLYIVLDGKVRIEKHIPGVGAEALAILERGDFFGEMAIVDRAPRSASAVAHAKGTTVLGIDKPALDALLVKGGEGAHALLAVLCRILSTRLREINDKIVQWRFMSGGF